MTKIQSGLEEIMTKHDIVIGDVSGEDFSKNADIPGLAIMQDVEAALPRCVAMIDIFAAAAAKEGPLADAAALKKAIDAAPGDLDIPEDILGNVARRAATETGLNVQELTQILDVSARKPNTAKSLARVWAVQATRPSGLLQLLQLQLLFLLVLRLLLHLRRC